MKEISKIYLLNEKAYEIITKVSAKDLFKNRALKQYALTEKELKLINPAKTDDPQKAKVFFYDNIGMARVYFNGASKATDWNKHLSEEACEIGKQARLNM